MKNDEFSDVTFYLTSGNSFTIQARDVTVKSVSSGRITGYSIGEIREGYEISVVNVACIEAIVVKKMSKLREKEDTDSVSIERGFPYRCGVCEGLIRNEVKEAAHINVHGKSAPHVTA